MSEEASAVVGGGCGADTETRIASPLGERQTPKAAVRGRALSGGAQLPPHTQLPPHPDSLPKGRGDVLTDGRRVRRLQNKQRVRAFLAAHLGAQGKEVARALGLSRTTVSYIISEIRDEWRADVAARRKNT